MDIDISPQEWGQQSAGLRSGGTKVGEMGAAASETMAGNPYGVCFTSIFAYGYRQLSDQFKFANTALGELFEATAQAVDDSAEDFRQVDDEVADCFMQVSKMIEALEGR